MSLLNEYAARFCRISKTFQDDGAGGRLTSWTDGEQFIAYQSHNSTIEAQVAESEKGASTYSFLVDKDCTLSAQDYVKRMDDGQIFIITQPTMEDYTPSSSRLNLTMVKARKGVLPET